MNHPEEFVNCGRVSTRPLADVFRRTTKRVLALFKLLGEKLCNVRWADAVDRQILSPQILQELACSRYLARNNSGVVLELYQPLTELAQNRGVAPSRCGIQIRCAFQTLLTECLQIMCRRSRLTLRQTARRRRC